MRRVGGGLARALGRALAGPGAPARRRRGKGLAPLQLLEDRRLPSAVPFNPSAPAEMLVNTTTAGSQQTFPQSRQAVATDAAGDFVTVWSSLNQDGSGWGVYGQRYNAVGVPQGPEFQVNTTTVHDQQYATVAMDAAGEFVVSWSSDKQDGSGWGVYGRRFDAAGNALTGEFRVNSTTAGDQMFSSVAMNGTGASVVVWQSQGQDGSGWGVYGQRFDASGNPVGTEFRVNTTTANDQQYAAVAMDPAGEFVVTWTSWGQDGDAVSASNVYAQRYDASGNPVGSEFRVNSLNAGSQDHSSVALDSAGNFAIAWGSTGDGLSVGYGVYAQAYTASGAASGGQFIVDSYFFGDQTDPTIAIGPAGNAVITWSSQGADGSGWGVSGQSYDAATWARVGGEFVVNTTTAGDQHFSSVATDAQGDVVVAWSGAGTGDNDGVFARRYGKPGVRVSPTSGLVTTEAGGTASFSVVLNSQPTDSVTIGVSSSDTTQGVVSTPSLTFTPANWNQAQTVTVTGQDDYIVNGDHAYTVTLSAAASNDPNYSGRFGTTLNVTNREADVAGIVVKPTSGLVTTEAGGTATFTVVLTSEPTADVTVPLRSNNPAQARVSAAALTFTAADWNAPQTVTVTGVDDFIADGDQPYTIITDPAVSADPHYRGFDAADVQGVNRNRDVAGITVSPTSGLVTTESGGTATFAVALTSKPTAAVQISLSSSNPSAGVPSASSLSFTPLNWDQPQSVTVTGVDDHIADGDIPYQIVTAPAASTDPIYQGLKGADVSLLNRNEDVAAVAGATPGPVVASGQGAAPPPAPAPVSVAVPGGPLPVSAPTPPSAPPPAPTLSPPATLPATPAAPALPVFPGTTEADLVAILASNIDLARLGVPQVSMASPALGPGLVDAPTPAGPQQGPSTSPQWVTAATPGPMFLQAVVPADTDSAELPPSPGSVLQRAMVLRTAAPQSFRNAPPRGLGMAPLTAEVETEPPTLASAANPVAAMARSPDSGAIPAPVLRELDRLAERVEQESWSPAEEAAVVAAVSVSVGYVALNIRNLYLLGTVLLSTPLWRQFDPQAVLDGWERDLLAGDFEDEEEGLRPILG